MTDPDAVTITGSVRVDLDGAGATIRCRCGAEASMVRMANPEGWEWGRCWQTPEGWEWGRCPKCAQEGEE